MPILLTPRYGRGSNPLTAEEQEAEDRYAAWRDGPVELTKEELNRREANRHKGGLKATIFELHKAKLYRRLVTLGYTKRAYSWMEQGPL